MSIAQKLVTILEEALVEFPAFNVFAGFVQFHKLVKPCLFLAHQTKGRRGFQCAHVGDNPLPLDKGDFRGLYHGILMSLMRVTFLHILIYPARLTPSIMESDSVLPCLNSIITSMGKAVLPHGYSESLLWRSVHFSTPIATKEYD